MKPPELFKKLPVFASLCIAFAIALFIRVVLPSPTVFKDGVRFASDDAIYHMRLVENALFGGHFPDRLFFDAYTYFPYGTHLHFAPLFDHLIIFATWLIGLGTPTRELMEEVGAYYPAVLGALVVFPVYIIGREICNKYAGVVAAGVIAVMPGAFLSRSIIGFTDHHIGEALFSTVAIMFLVLAVKKAKEELQDKENVKSFRELLKCENYSFLFYITVALLFLYLLPWGWGLIVSFGMFLLAPLLFLVFKLAKKPASYFFYIPLAGMALGFYLLTWTPGLFFTLIIFVYGVVQCIVNGFRGESSDYIYTTLPIVFLISLLMVIPFLQLTPFYDVKHVLAPCVGIATFGIPLLYKKYLTGFGLKKNAGEVAVNAEIMEGYVCPICKKKTKGVGIIDHIRTKHKGAAEVKGDFAKLKHFLDENPELRSAAERRGIMPKATSSPISETIAKYDFLFPLSFGVALFALSLSFFPSLMGSFQAFAPTAEMLTVGEVQPMNMEKAWWMFTTSFFIAFFALALLAVDVVRENKPEKVLVLIWSVVMLIIVGGLGYVGQIRFAYYYAVNAAILTGFFSVKAFEFLTGEREVKEEIRDKGKKGGGKNRIKDNATETQVILFGIGIMVMAVIGLLKIGVESVLPMAAITVVFFLWIWARRERKPFVKTLTKSLAVVFIIFIVFYPSPLNIATSPFPSTSNLPQNVAFSINTAKQGIGADDEWYEALRWMKDNTPHPGIDYYGMYEEPPKNETTGGWEDYDYPPEAYGVMSWWDYGHMITWVAHRIPNANPFQEGAQVAAKYLIATDEAEANEILEELGTRYIITDFSMVDFMGAPPHPKYVMPVWAGQNPNPWFTIEARLHYFDGCGEDVEAGAVAPLTHYRLVHESPTYILPFLIMDTETSRAMFWNSYMGGYSDVSEHAQVLHAHLFTAGAEGVREELNNRTVPEAMREAFKTIKLPLSEQSTVRKEGRGWRISDEISKNVFIVNDEGEKLNVYLYGVRIREQMDKKVWTPEYVKPMSFVKVFEYVEGATIEGTAPNATLVEISTTITTSRGREFVYSQQAISDGNYEFVVPYSSEGPIEEGTNFDVFAVPYQIRVGDVEMEVSVSEEAVMDGKRIVVNF